jgi:hypothetical protein
MAQSFNLGELGQIISFDNNITRISSNVSTNSVAANNLSLSGSLTMNGSMTFVNSISSGNAVSGAVTITGGLGVLNNLYVGGRVGYSNTANVSVVYTYYNPSTNSLDTVFN